MGSRSASLAGSGTVLALLLAAPRPSQALRTVADAATAADPLAPVLAAVSIVAWGLTGWLLLVCLTTAAGQLPGLLGAGARLLGQRIAPRAVRHAAALALGVSALTGIAGADPALAAAPAASVSAEPPAPPVLDWPTEPAPAKSAGVAGSAATEPAHFDGLPAGPAAVARVVVRPGDSLWAIAERQLPLTATPAQIAASWPRWWAANRGVIGADPNLIQPGARLTPPSTP